MFDLLMKRQPLTSENNRENILYIVYTEVVE
jgi:hypothetical protein